MNNFEDTNPPAPRNPLTRFDDRLTALSHCLPTDENKAAAVR